MATFGNANHGDRKSPDAAMPGKEEGGERVGRKPNLIISLLPGRLLVGPSPSHSTHQEVDRASVFPECVSFLTVHWSPQTLLWDRSFKIIIPILQMRELRDRKGH